MCRRLNATDIDKVNFYLQSDCFFYKFMSIRKRYLYIAFSDNGLKGA